MVRLKTYRAFIFITLMIEANAAIKEVNQVIYTNINLSDRPPLKSLCRSESGEITDQLSEVA